MQACRCTTNELYSSAYVSTIHTCTQEEKWTTRMLKIDAEHRDTGIKDIADRTSELYNGIRVA